MSAKYLLHYFHPILEYSAMNALTCWLQIEQRIGYMKVNHGFASYVMIGCHLCVVS